VSFQPFLLATFCDDVREEAGNKVSFMGIYGANLVVRSFPTTLLKLCCVFNVRIPVTMKPRRVLLRLLRDDQPIFEAEVAPTAANEAAARLSDEAADAHAIAFGFVAQLVNLQVSRRSILRAQAVVDGREIRGGGLELIAAEGTH
jgi:hypothetical protein